MVYIEYTLNYTFIHFGMSISCKKWNLLISKYATPHFRPECHHFDKWCKYKLGALFSIKLLLNIEKYYIITEMMAPLQYSVWWVKRSLKFKFELWQPMKVKRANRLISIIDEIWVIHLQKVDTLSMIGI